MHGHQEKGRANRSRMARPDTDDPPYLLMNRRMCSCQAAAWVAASAALARSTIAPKATVS